MKWRVSLGSYHWMFDTFNEASIFMSAMVDHIVPGDIRMILVEVVDPNEVES